MDLRLQDVQPGFYMSVSSIVSPTGLRETVRYKAQGHQLPNKGTFQNDTLCNLAYRPTAKRPATRRDSLHLFGEDLFGLQQWSRVGRRPRQSVSYRASTDYQYTSTVQIKGGAKTTNIYNKVPLEYRNQAANWHETDHANYCLPQLPTQGLRGPTSPVSAAQGYPDNVSRCSHPGDPESDEPTCLRHLGKSCASTRGLEGEGKTETQLQVSGLPHANKTVEEGWSFGKQDNLRP